LARKAKPQPKRKLNFRWRKPTIILLTSLGLLFLTGFTIIHWTQRQLLTTDNWIKLVAPLPKDKQVSAALADYSVNKAFEAISVEQKITEALPPKAAFLAPALTERVDVRATNLAQNLIQSDQFQGVWIAANRQAHEKLMTQARGSGDQSQDGKASFNLKLEDLLSSVRERLGSSSQPLFDRSDTSNETGNSVGFGVDLKSRLETFNRYITAADFLNSVLLLAALAALIGALALSDTRRRLLLIILASVSVISLLQLIGVRILRPEILNQIENAAYRPAVGVIYDELLASLRSTATSVFAASTVLFVLVWAYDRLFKRNKYLRVRLRELQSTAFWVALRRLRIKLYRYRYAAVGVLAFIVLTFMAFALDFDWTGVVRSTLLILLIIGLVHIIVIGPSSAKTRQKVSKT